MRMSTSQKSHPEARLDDAVKLNADLDEFAALKEIIIMVLDFFPSEYKPGKKAKGKSNVPRQEGGRGVVRAAAKRASKRSRMMEKGEKPLLISISPFLPLFSFPSPFPFSLLFLLISLSPLISNFSSHFQFPISAQVPISI